MERREWEYVADHIREGVILDMERREVLHNGLLQRVDLGPTLSIVLRR